MSERKVAFITGITGQDGSYLAELLLEKGYETHGIIRRCSSFNTGRIDHIFSRLHIHYGDLSDGSALARLLRDINPTEVYNLGAQSHVRVSFDIPEYTFDIGATGTLRLLEAVRSSCPAARYYQASSSEMFGSAPSPQSESTAFQPQSPYAVAKVAAYHLTRLYRNAYGLHCSNGILFNHESPRRGATFVTQKIVKGCVAQWAYKNLPDYANKPVELALGNLKAKRDWGHAADYVRAMWMMVQAENPGDYVVATGKTYSVEYFLYAVIQKLGLTSDEFIRIDPRLFRPCEVDLLLGDNFKIWADLNWQPVHTLDTLIDDMITAEKKHYEHRH